MSGTQKKPEARSLAPSLALLSLALLCSSVTAPLAAQSAPPGAGAQVHTGSNSGIDDATRLQNLLADHQFLRIEAQLDKLPPQQAQLYRGILANRSNNLDQSIQLLAPLVDKIAASGDLTQEKLLRKTLAEDYLRQGDWSKAAQAYQALDQRLQGHLSADEQDEIEMPRKLSQLAAGNASPPVMTVEPCAPFVLQTSRDPLGLIDLPVFVDAHPHSWMLDPTAPFNLIARSLAKEAGLKLSAQSTTIHTLTGRPIEIYVTVIPRFTIGGKLTLRNMTAFVFDDADYAFSKSHYQVQGVLGYPALAALGSLTVTANSTIEVQPAKEPSAADEKAGTLTTGARFYLDGNQLIAALGKAGSASSQKENAQEENVFVVNAASQQTYLTSRYYDEHASDFTGQKMEPFAVPGSELLPPQPAYTAENVSLRVGSTVVNLHFVQVLTQPLGSEALDDVYGVLGIDALEQFSSYTFDYRTMRFSVTPE